MRPHASTCRCVTGPHPAVMSFTMAQVLWHRPTYRGLPRRAGPRGHAPTPHPLTRHDHGPTPQPAAARQVLPRRRAPITPHKRTSPVAATREISPSMAGAMARARNCARAGYAARGPSPRCFTPNRGRLHALSHLGVALWRRWGSGVGVVSTRCHIAGGPRRGAGAQCRCSALDEISVVVGAPVTGAG